MERFDWGSMARDDCAEEACVLLKADDGYGRCDCHTHMQCESCASPLRESFDPTVLKAAIRKRHARELRPINVNTPFPEVGQAPHIAAVQSHDANPPARRRLRVAAGENDIVLGYAENSRSRM